MSFCGKALLMCAPLFLRASCFAQWDDSLLKPFVMDHRAATMSPADVSFLLDAPAGKAGFIRVQGGHFVSPTESESASGASTSRIGVRGRSSSPPRKIRRCMRAALARYGVNIVRLHFLDKWAPTGIVDGSRDDTRSFDPQQLDRLDFLVAELKKNGIYMDLNLNVGREYKDGDGLPDARRIRMRQGSNTL